MARTTRRPASVSMPAPAATYSQQDESQFRSSLDRRLQALAAYVDAIVNDPVALSGHTQPWSTITDRATTLSGYGITDAAAGVSGVATDSDKLDGQHGSYYAIAGAAPTAHGHPASDISAGLFGAGDYAIHGNFSLYGPSLVQFLLGLEDETRAAGIHVDTDKALIELSNFAAYGDNEHRWGLWTGIGSNTLCFGSLDDGLVPVVAALSLVRGTGTAITAAEIGVPLFTGNITSLTDYTNLGAECYAQSTFTPLYDKWAVEGDFAFVADVLTYDATGGNEYGTASQAIGDLTHPVPMGMYRFAYTLATVTAGDLTLQVYDPEQEIVLGSTTPVAGANHFDFYWRGSETVAPALLAYGGMGTFQVTDVSLKPAPGGIAGYTHVETVELMASGLIVGSSIVGGTVSGTTGTFSGLVEGSSGHFTNANLYIDTAVGINKLMTSGSDTHGDIFVYLTALNDWGTFHCGAVISEYGFTAPVYIGTQGGPLALQTYSTIDTATVNLYYTNAETPVYRRVLDIVAFGAPDGTYGDSVIRFLTNPVTLGASATEVGRISQAGLVLVGDVNIASGKAYKIDGVQLVGAQGALVADPTGGVVVDAEARTALAALLARVRTHGLIATA